MAKTKSFHLGDVLSITTGVLVSPRLLDGVCEILNFMTGEDLLTHQLPRAASVCGPALLRQFPALAAVNVACFDEAEDVTKEIVAEWLDDQVAQHGETFEVAPLPAGEYQSVHPLAELANMMAKRG